MGDILPAVLRRLGLDRKMEEGRLRREWPGVVGDALAGRSRPRFVKGGQLFIAVDNNVWMQEIRFHQREIVERVGRLFPDLDVRGIRLTLEKEEDE
ncbi:MAG: DUF721 domain-containing protein [Candidatus Krumholzibacteriota bacterium]|nr:DUF721 domain-containing protein [Candidatus Krumholzibacteriota bacterium]